MLGTVWVAVDIGSVAKSGSPQRGPSGDKKENEGVEQNRFYEKKNRSTKNGLSVVKYVE
jgi:hypothetical protein